MKRISLFATVLFFVFLSACTEEIFSGQGNEKVSTTRAGKPRPAQWAAPLSRPGLGNLFKVSPDLYRRAKPSREGYAELKKLGIKTNINLEIFHSESDKIAESGYTFNYVHIFMQTWHPEEEDLVRF
jgi:hypothetical protein